MRKSIKTLYEIASTMNSINMAQNSFGSFRPMNAKREDGNILIDHTAETRIRRRARRSAPFRLALGCGASRRRFAASA
ncbi:hypothetical protein DI44_16570 [Geobacillus sp. CAMR5420]|nr:hypothetical protein DI44_16570 [Geobacillus sp. CAMR5420]